MSNAYCKSKPVSDPSMKHQIKGTSPKNDYKEIQGLKLLHFLIDQSLRVPVKNGKPRYSLVVIIQQGGRCRPF